MQYVLELLLDLSPEVEPQQQRRSRAVMDGHYVPILPEPLAQPQLVAVSDDMCEALGLQPEAMRSQEMVKLLAGHVADLPLKPFATPYGTSVNGSFAADSPFGPWGYGDGRAISLGRFKFHDEPWELQLKGAGRTPFSRNFDGRAVLRSCVREFLASEAMHHLGVPTARSLSVVTSSEKVTRPWYTAPAQQASGQRSPPKCNQEEACAMLCRCARSFWRVGHVELFARRPDAAQALRDFLWHVFRTDFPQLAAQHGRLEDLMVAFFAEFVQAQAELVAEWLRVGYVHGNMNSDNCLLCSQTLDFGPFAFMEEYNGSYQPFTSDHTGHYAFARQPEAAQATLRVLAEQLPQALPVAEQRGCAERLEEILASFDDRFKQAHHDRCRRKLGFSAWDAQEGEIWKQLLELMTRSEADFTILFRSLVWLDVQKADLKDLKRAFPSFPGGQLLSDWMQWLRSYCNKLQRDGRDTEARTAEMCAASPKYVPRNWMLFESYDAANRGDYQVTRGMLELFQSPYDEQPIFEEAYFRSAPEWARSKGGIHFMS